MAEKPGADTDGGEGVDDNVMVTEDMNSLTANNQAWFEDFDNVVSSEEDVPSQKANRQAWFEDFDDVVTSEEDDVPPSQAAPSQPKLDTTEHKKKLLNVILKAVINGHARVVVKAMEALKEHCDIQSLPVGGQLLDFLPDKNSTTLQLHVPAAHKFHSPLMIACEKERQDLVELLLDQGASVAFKNKDKLTALHISCNKGNLAIVDLLLQHVGKQKRFTKKAQHTSDLILAVNVRNEKGWTPLMYAIKGGHVEIVNKLIETGQIDYQLKNKKHCSILHIASGGSKVECLEKVVTVFEGQDNEMILAKDKNGWNTLHHACTSTNIEVLKWLLDHLSEEDRTKLIDQQDNAGYTPCLKACEYQNIDALKMLLEHGADITLCAKDRDSKKNVKEGEKSALHIAAIHDSKEIAQLLLEKECPIDIVDSEGNSPLHVAYKKSSFEVIAVLRHTKDGRLETLTNKKNKLAVDVTPEDVIPPEIKKRGKVAIDLYKKALKEGKKKIPRCNLLILGHARVGKTSAYRLLVGLGFNPKQEPTMGIDNKEVDTLDTRHVDIALWEEKKEDAQKEQSKALFAGGVVGHVRDKLPPKKNSKKFEPIVSSESQLLKEVADVKRDIEHKKQAAIYSVDTLSKRVRSMDISHPTAPQLRLRQQPITKTEERHTAPPIFVAPPPSEERPKPAPKEPSEIKTPVPVLPLPPKSEPVRRAPPRTVTDSYETVRPVTEQSVPPTPKEAPPPETMARIGRRDSHSINKLLKSDILQEEKASLILTILDFAGQPIYRPMHHCFIRRRAIYIVVCNLQKLVKYLQSGKKGDNPIEEIRYWIHSIHAHIYPPDENERGNDKKMKRICLVGTHREPKDPKQGQKVTEDELDAINELLEDEIYEDNRCVNHLHRMKDGRLFLALENSIDGKESKDRENSGAKALQDELKDISQHLSFLKEEFPIVWLQFESELMRMREYRNQMSLPMIVELTELQKLAQQVGITVPEAQNLAFQFFHDIGKIVYFKHTPTIFLSEDEKRQLADLVILDPTWLIKVIKIIFEIESHDEVPEMEVRDLKKTGVASCKLLKACWSEFTKSTSFQKLCLMLQANCLIYPLSNSPCPDLDRAESDPVPSDNLPPNQPERSRTDPTQETTDEKVQVSQYLVPCRLPKECKPNKADSRMQWMTFYFDFNKFLPEVIFHRFICLMLATSQSKRSKKKKLNDTFSSTCCTFYNIDECHWKIELERNLHRLRVSVASHSEKSPSQYIIDIHTQYLKKICQDSNLQGLEYWGGPLVKCVCECGDKEVLEFVKYENGDSVETKPACSYCFHLYDVNILLKSQVKPQVIAKAGLKIETDGKESTATEDFSAPLIEVATNAQKSSPKVCSTSSSVAGMGPVELKTGNRIPSEKETFKCLLPVASHWQNIGVLLGISEEHLQTIKADNRDQSIDCLREMIRTWRKQSADLDPSWSALCEAVRPLNPKVADHIEKQTTN